jgi:hypothetical protein
LVHPVLTGLDLSPDPTGRQLITTLLGFGTMRPARLHSARANQQFFPNLEHLRPHMAVLAEPFNLVFPQPRLAEYP